MTLSPSMGFLARYVRWINWKLEPDPYRPDKPRKVPIDPRTGYACAATDQSAHTDYATARAAADSRGHGVGFVFVEGDGLWFLDLDKCRIGDSWTPLALSIIEAFGGHAACEISQSGNGLHLFGYAANIPVHGCKNIPLKLELYHNARFVAFTDNCSTGAIDADTSDVLARIIANYFPKTAANSDVVDWTDTGMPDSPGGADEDDDRLLAIMLRSGQTTAKAMFSDNHVAFADLWLANDEKLSKRWPDNEGTQGRAFDHSHADSALASLLAYWTAKNCERMETFMRMSRLARGKWDNHATYLTNTILNACAIVSNYAKPREIQEPLTAGFTGAVTPVVGFDYSGTAMTATLTIGAAAQPEGAPATDAAPPAAGGTPIEDLGPGVLARKGVQFMNAADQVRFFKGCTYVRDLNQIWVARDGSLQDKSRFDITHSGAVFITRSDNVGRPEKSAWEAYLKNQQYAPRLANRTCFRPEIPSGTITAEGALNVYIERPTPQTAGDASKWELHLSKLFPDHDDRAIIVSYMAAALRNPGVKAQWWPVIQGCEGNGKSIINTVMSFGTGESYTHFVRTAALAKTGVQFNKWCTGNLFLSFEEINVGEKRNFLEEIKDIVTNLRIPLESKGVDQETGDNRANGMMFTNYKGAVPIARGGRRYSIFYCPQQDESDLEPWGMGGDYFPDLHDWMYGRNAYAGHGVDYGLRVINHWLRNVAVIDPRFDITGACQRAPATSSRVEALQNSLGTVEQEVIEAVENGSVGFCGGWINGFYLDALLSGLRVRIARNKRREMLHELGFIPHPGLPDGRCVSALEGLGVRPRLYVRFGHLSCNMSNPKAIQEAYERAQVADRKVTGVAA